MVTAGDDSSGAEFSDCGHWRYSLWRRWDISPVVSMVMFVGLNPSTADETDNDPTVRRCINFAKRWGFGGMFMMNAYGFRATEPRNMRIGRRCDYSPVVTNDPVGAGNNDALSQRALQSALVIAAWGTNCTIEREAEALAVMNTDVFCLGKTKHGRPRHPLYLKNEVNTELFWSPPRVCG